MWRASLLFVALLGCSSPSRTPARRSELAGGVASEPPQAPAETSTRTDAAPSATASDEREPCLVVAGELEGKPASATGTLVVEKGAFVLRLARPRCVVGLARASLLTELAVVTTAADLRPLAGATVRIDGDVIGGTNDLGGPAIVLIARDVSRAASPAPP